MRRSLSLLSALAVAGCLIWATSASAATTGSPTLVAAGDIACAPGSLPTATTCQQSGTAALVQSLHPSAVAALGDEQYESGTSSEFAGAFNPSWGTFKSLIRPAVGNHEYLTPGAAGYFNYFGAAAGPQGKGYYSYDLGSWHLIALNSNCEYVSCAAGSQQEQWLRADLAAHPATCTLAYWHHPLFTSGPNQGQPDDLATRPLWQALFDYHASVVLNGHDHDYERFTPQDANGQANPHGVREFVVGTGGKSHFQFSATSPNSAVRNASSFGVLLLTLNPASYSWRFVPENPAGFTDQGSAACVNAQRSTSISSKAHGKKQRRGVALLVTGTIRVGDGTPVAKFARAAHFSSAAYPCGGNVWVKVKFRGKRVARRSASVHTIDCRWRKRLVFSLSKLPGQLRFKGPPVSLKVTARYGGDSLLGSSSAPPIRLSVR